ncbi:MAG: hypothetical protein ACE5KZ_01080 [Candidatus Scalinduaceae bacterium]
MKLVTAIANKFYISHKIISGTEAYLKLKGEIGKEGLVLWAGKRAQESSIITTMFVGGSEWGEGVSLEQNDLIRLVTKLSRHSLTLLAQVHSHPNQVEHSTGDERHPVSFHIGYISIVVWNYCLSGMELSKNCYIYEYQGKLWWRKLPVKEIQKRFIILPLEIRI